MTVMWREMSEKKVLVRQGCQGRVVDVMMDNWLLQMGCIESEM